MQQARQRRDAEGWGPDLHGIVNCSLFAGGGPCLRFVFKTQHLASAVKGGVPALGKSVSSEGRIVEKDSFRAPPEVECSGVILLCCMTQISRTRATPVFQFQ